MAYPSYSYRLIVDYDFVKWISSSERKTQIISKLLRINKNSKDYKNKQIIILKEDYEKLCDDGIIKNKTMILGCLCPKEINEEVSSILGDRLEKLPVELRRGMLGVLLTSSRPFKSVLFTTKKSLSEYTSSGFDDFSRTIDNFSLKNEDESLYIIDKLYKEYTDEREMCR